MGEERRRFTAAECEAMQRMRAAGDKLATIAHRFRCSTTSVQRIVRDVPRGPWRRADGTVRSSAPGYRESVSRVLEDA